MQLKEWICPPPVGKTFAPSLQPALELIYLARLQPEEASQSLRKLLLANPNYFGCLPENSYKVVLNMNGDTCYESLGCVSYIPLLGQLYASIKLHQDCGYSFQVNEPASREYVRFYLSYDRGVTWHDQGLTSINVCDEAGAKKRVHLVTKRISLHEEIVEMDEPPIVRATLSWRTPPPSGTPDWTPLWGNVLEAPIQNLETMFVGRVVCRGVPGNRLQAKQPRRNEWDVPSTQPTSGRLAPSRQPAFSQNRACGTGTSR